MKVYGANICIGCRNLKAVLASRKIDMEFIDITENTANMKAFLTLRDHSDVFEKVRNKEGGAIGIPCFVSEKGKITLDMNEAFSWIGQPPVREEELPEKRQ